MPTKQHRYMCECSDPTCKRELELTHTEYLRLASKGAVRHPDCPQYGRRQGRAALAGRA